MKRAFFLGRWQPCHLAHEWLIRQKLDADIPCHVQIRDIVPDEQNPFTTDQTIEILKAAFTGEDVTFQKVPDCESINWGRGVGYETNDHGECPIVGISGTKVREILNSEDGDKLITLFLSPAVAAKVKEIHGR